MWWWNNSGVSRKDQGLMVVSSEGRIVELCPTLTNKEKILRFIRRICHSIQ